MKPRYLPCIYCTSDIDVEAKKCPHCGMATPEKHPADRHQNLNKFVLWFLAILVFCFVMMFYLPR